MHEYDTVLKALLQSPQSTVLERITGARIERWLNVEFSRVRQLRMDLLGATLDGRRLVDLELQSTNDSKIEVRMAEYALMSFREYGVFPEQYVLYVGQEKMRMKARLTGPSFKFKFKLIDIRDLDEEVLLSSPFDSDNILAILTKNKDRRETIRRILARIATLEGERRYESFQKLMILSGLRKLGGAIRAEVKHMPILDDIMDHDLLGPAIRQGRQEGKQEGKQEAWQEILRGLLNKRFGTTPGWLDEALTKLSVGELKDISLQIFDAKSIDELFPR